MFHGDLLSRASAWIVGDDTGLSSKHIWAVMTGVPVRHRFHPVDPSDFGRCLRLLAAIPEWKHRLNEMSAQSEQWAALVTNWADLETLYLAEAGSLEPEAGRTAPRLYDRMQSILRSAASGRRA